MDFPVKVLSPILPPDAKEIYLRGYITFSEQNEITIYLSRFSATLDDLLQDQSNHLKNIVFGYCGDCIPKKIIGKLDYLLMEKSNPPILNKLVINGKQIENNCILMLYDYDKVKESQSICEYNDFLKLQNFIQDEYGQRNHKETYKPTFKNPTWISSSMFLQHILNYLNLMKWLVATIKKDRKISIKQGNLILAIITDIILGCVLLQLLSQDKKDISSVLMGLLEKLINSLYSLLKWLMGAPVGLKLNNAFNKMLGKYFSYHVQLWWLFLDVSGEKLDIILHVYRYIGYLGFTFQTAVICDLICIATFHSYCIYVYAARLFNMQVSGLIALLRLFVGRKYNPLRGGIDSCEYTNQELFVGTVAFTILLLLLPTTTLYYIVFTMFRVLSLMVQHVLAKLIYMTQTLPLYVVTLWLIQSPKVAGNILIEVVKSSESSLILKVKLFSKSIQELVSKFTPPVEVPNQVEWTNLLSNVFVGKQIVWNCF